MHRIISGTLLIGIILPIFIGIFPVNVTAQTGPLDNMSLERREQIQSFCSGLETQGVTPRQFITTTVPVNQAFYTNIIRLYSDLLEDNGSDLNNGLLTQLQSVADFQDGIGIPFVTDAGELNADALKVLELIKKISPALNELESMRQPIGLDNRNEYVTGQIPDLLTRQAQEIWFDETRRYDEDGKPTDRPIQNYSNQAGGRVFKNGAAYSFNKYLEGLSPARQTFNQLEAFNRKLQENLNSARNNLKALLIDEQRAVICEQLASTNPDQTIIDRAVTDIDRQSRLQQEALSEDLEFVRDDPYSTQNQANSTCLSLIEGINWRQCAGDIIEGVFAVLNNLAVMILSFSGLVFDASIKISILEFKYLADSLGIKAVWELFRDVANMLAIFLLLYIALSTILQLNKINTQKAITTIIIAALLINFSAVLTRVTIDISNVTALVFYNQITKNSVAEKNIASLFLGESGFNKVATIPAPEAQDSSIPLGGLIAKGFGNFIMLIGTSWVILLAAGFFIVRSVTLIILIVTSPLALIGFAVPWLEVNVTRKWQDELIKQLVFAPVFMGLLYASLTMSLGISSVILPDSIGNIIGQVILYVLSILMLFGSLMIARSSANGVASSKLKGIGLGGAALAGAGIGLLGTNIPGRIAQRRVEAGKGGWLTNRLARATYNPYTFTAGNMTKAEKKVTDILSGKGGEIKNKSFRDAQQSADKAKKEKAKARVDEHKYNMKGMSTDTEKAKYVASVADEDERKELYKELTVGERGKYESAAKTAGDTFTEGRLKELRDKLKDEDQEKTDKAYNQANRSAISKTSKDEILELASVGTTPAAILADPIATRLGLTAANLATEIETRIKQIGPDGIMKISREKTVMDTILANPLINEYLTPSFLTKIEKAWLEENAVSDATISDIYRHLYTVVPPPPATVVLSPKEKALNDWFDYNVTFR